MSAAIFSVVSVVAVSAISLVGLLTLGTSELRIRRLTSGFVSFAVGALLGDAFFHLVPEAVGRGPPLRGALGVIVGFLIFFVLEKLLRRAQSRSRLRPGLRLELVVINLAGDGLHNFIDGLVIGASYLVNPGLGISTTLAVIAHELPQELGDFGILLHGGLSVRQAVLWNVASAATALLGTGSALVLGALAGGAVASALVPFTAGGFVYLAAADLVPELHRDLGLRALFAQSTWILAGVATMAALTLVD